jgi:hypothetical protein
MDPRGRLSGSQGEGEKGKNEKREGLEKYAAWSWTLTRKSWANGGLKPKQR